MRGIKKTKHICFVSGPQTNARAVPPEFPAVPDASLLSFSPPVGEAS